MKIEHRVIPAHSEWPPLPPSAPAGPHPQLVFAFGPRDALEDPALFWRLRAHHPHARIVVASCSGEISGAEVVDDHLAITAIAFERSTVSAACIPILDRAESFSAGETLAKQLAAPDLVHVFVFADGQLTNGSQLALGFNNNLPAGVTVSGGLAGDGTRFQKTLVGLDEPPSSGRIVAVASAGCVDSMAELSRWLEAA